jgi:hypothetical protein
MKRKQTIVSSQNFLFQNMESRLKTGKEMRVGGER